MEIWATLLVPWFVVNQMPTKLVKRVCVLEEVEEGEIRLELKKLEIPRRSSFNWDEFVFHLLPFLLCHLQQYCNTDRMPASD